MYGLGQDLEFMALGAGTLQKVRGSGLAGEQQNLALREPGARQNRRLDSRHTRHDDIGG